MFIKILDRVLLNHSFHKYKLQAVAFQQKVRQSTAFTNMVFIETCLCYLYREGDALAKALGCDHLLTLVVLQQLALVHV